MRKDDAETVLELLDQAPQCDPVQESPWCTWVLNATGNEWLAASADWLIAKPLKIVIILVVAFIVRYLVRRLIDTLTRPRTGSGSTPAISRPLRERAPQMLSTAVIERRRQRAQTIGSVLKSIATFLILGVAILEILAELGINIGPIVASAGIVGVALGFGAQNLVRDFLSGMFMMVEDQYGVGDFVDVGEAAGTVEAVGLRVTTLRDLNGTVWYVRNGEILRVGNSSQGFAVAVVDVPLAHKSDLSLATSLIAEVAEQVAAEPPVSDAVLEPAEVLGVESVTVEGIQLRLTVKVKPGEQWSVQRVLRGRITSALKEAGFDSPLARIFGPQQNNSAQ